MFIGCSEGYRYVGFVCERDLSWLISFLGPHPTQLFTVDGKGHAFEQHLFLGDPGLKEVEEAWAAVEKIVKEDAKTSVWI